MFESINTAHKQKVLLNGIYELITRKLDMKLFNHFVKEILKVYHILQQVFKIKIQQDLRNDWNRLTVLATATNEQPNVLQDKRFVQAEKKISHTLLHVIGLQVTSFIKVYLYYSNVL